MDSFSLGKFDYLFQSKNGLRYVSSTPSLKKQLEIHSYEILSPPTFTLNNQCVSLHQKHSSSLSRDVVPKEFDTLICKSSSKEYQDLLAWMDSLQYSWGVKTKRSNRVFNIERNRVKIVYIGLSTSKTFTTNVTIYPQYLVVSSGFYGLIFHAKSI